MTDTTTTAADSLRGLAREQAAEIDRLETENANLRDRIEDRPIAEMLAAELNRIKLIMREQAAEIERLTQLAADYEEVLADHRRLVRELDVALHGEHNAAPQASLCDLIDPAKNLRTRIAEFREALKELADAVVNPGDGGPFEQGELPALDKARAILAVDTPT